MLPKKKLIKLIQIKRMKNNSNIKAKI